MSIAASYLAFEELPIYNLREVLNQYIDCVKKVIESEKLLLDRKFEELSDEDRENYYHYEDSLIDEYQRLDKDIPILLNNTTFIVVFSKIESKLKDLRIALASVYDIEGMTINPGDKIDKYYKDIMEACRITNPEIEAHWTKINRFYKEIRNLIIHHDAMVTKDIYKTIEEQTHYNLINDCEDIQLMSDGAFFIKDDSFVRKFLNEAVEFIRLLVKEMIKADLKRKPFVGR